MADKRCAAMTVAGRLGVGVLLLAGASGQAGLPWISRLLGRELTLARTGHAE